MTDLAFDLSPTESREVSPQARSYVAFVVHGRNFALPIEDVREIRAWSGTTQLPKAPPYVMGVMNLRGSIVPIVDVAARFNIGQAQPTPTHVVIVSAIGTRPVGLLVDAVSDIIDTEPSDLRPVPEEAVQDSDGLAGLLTYKNLLVALIDVPKLAADAASL